MDQCYPKSVPADPSNHVSASMSPSTEQEKRVMLAFPVREAVGSLMCLAGMTRPDVAHAVNQVAAFVSNPGKGHWEAIKQILAYLAGTINFGICYGGEGMSATAPLIGFSDASLASDLQTRKSTTGFCFQLYGGLVAWVSKRQRCVAISTADSEFYAASESSRDAIWLKAVLSEVGVETGPIPIYCDNRSAISIIQDPGNHQKIKHIDIRYFFVREHQEQGRIKMESISGKEQTADILTKALGKRVFEYLRNKMGIIEITK